MSKRRKSIPAEATKVFSGVIFDVYQWQQSMFDGSVQTFERLRRPNTAQVIAVVGDKILIQDEEQPDGLGAFASIPGGRCDPGEDPLTSAKRELAEETGYVSDDWTLWQETDPVGKIEWTVYTFIARQCRKENEPHLDVGEKITPRLVTFDEFIMLSDDFHFYSPELVSTLLRMRLDPAKKEEFRRLLFGS